MLKRLLGQPKKVALLARLLALLVAVATIVILIVSPEAWGDPLANKNSIIIRGNKHVLGTGVPAGTVFELTLYQAWDAGGEIMSEPTVGLPYPNPTTVETANPPEETYPYQFDKVTGLVPGHTYYFVVEETVPSPLPAGWAYDPQPRRVIIVHNDLNGDAEIVTDGAPGGFGKMVGLPSVKVEPADDLRTYEYEIFLGGFESFGNPGRQTLTGYGSGIGYQIGVTQTPSAQFIANCANFQNGTAPSGQSHAAIAVPAPGDPNEALLTKQAIAAALNSEVNCGLDIGGFNRLMGFSGTGGAPAPLTETPSPGANQRMALMQYMSWYHSTLDSTFRTTLGTAPSQSQLNSCFGPAITTAHYTRALNVIDELYDNYYALSGSPFSYDLGYDPATGTFTFSNVVNLNPAKIEQKVRVEATGGVVVYNASTPLTSPNNEITISNGMQLTVQDVPSDRNFTVTFTDAPLTLDGSSLKGYQITWANGSQPLMAATCGFQAGRKSYEHRGETEGSDSLDFTNTYAAPSGGAALELTKLCEGDGFDENKLFAFTVTFSGAGLAFDNLLCDEEPFSNGGTVYLKHNQTAIFTGIPAGADYTIEEADYSSGGYTSDHPGNTATGTLGAVGSAGGINWEALHLDNTRNIAQVVRNGASSAVVKYWASSYIICEKCGLKNATTATGCANPLCPQFLTYSRHYGELGVMWMEDTHKWYISPSLPPAATVVGALYCLDATAFVWDDYMNYKPNEVPGDVANTALYENQGIVRWIISNGYQASVKPVYSGGTVVWNGSDIDNLAWMRTTYGLPALTQAEAYAATQLAIWTYTNPSLQAEFVPESGGAYQNIYSLYTQLVATAAGKNVPPAYAEMETIDIAFDTHAASLAPDGWYGPITITATQSQPGANPLPIALLSQWNTVASGYYLLRDPLRSIENKELIVESGDQFYVKIGEIPAGRTAILRAEAWATDCDSQGAQIYAMWENLAAGVILDHADWNWDSAQPVGGMCSAITAISMLFSNGETTSGGSDVLTYTNSYEKPGFVIPGDKVVEAGENVSGEVPNRTVSIQVMQANAHGYVGSVWGWPEGEPEHIVPLPEPNPFTVPTTGEGTYPFTFGPITGLLPNTTYYFLFQELGSVPGWTDDYEKLVTISTDSTGKATIVDVSGDGPGGLTFNNQYEDPTGSFWVDIEKDIVFDGEAPPEIFQFRITEVLDSQGTPFGPEDGEPRIYQDEIDTGGEVLGPRPSLRIFIDGLPPGEYWFTVEELDCGVPGWDCDDTVYIIGVIVDEDGNTASLTPETWTFGKFADPLEFTNTYEKPGGFVVPGDKTISEGAPGGETFHFLLQQVANAAGDPLDPEPAPYTAEIEGDGTFEFHVTDLDAGEYWFRMTEEPGDDPAWTYDPAEHIIKVIVELVGGELVATVTADEPASATTEDGGPGEAVLDSLGDMINAYADLNGLLFTLKTAPASAGYSTITITLEDTSGLSRTVTGRILYSTNGSGYNNVPGATNVQLPITTTLTVLNGHRYNFYYSTSLDGVNTYPLKNPQNTNGYLALLPGALSVLNGLPDNGITVTGPTTLSGLTISTPTVADAVLSSFYYLKLEYAAPDGTRHVVPLSGPTYVSLPNFVRVSNRTIPVPEIELTQEGTYTFYVYAAVSDSEANFSFYNPYIKETASKGNVTFANTYGIELEGKKIVEGEDAPDEDFEFLLLWVDENGVEIVGPPPPPFTMPEENPITVKTNGAGAYSFKFGPITGLEPDTVYYFKIIETKGSNAGWAYDGSEYIVVVAVGGSGRAEVYYPQSGDVESDMQTIGGYTNTYAKLKYEGNYYRFLNDSPWTEYWAFCADKFLSQPGGGDVGNYFDLYDERGIRDDSPSALAAALRSFDTNARLPADDYYLMFGFTEGVYPFGGNVYENDSKRVWMSAFAVWYYEFKELYPQFEWDLDKTDQWPETLPAIYYDDNPTKIKYAPRANVATQFLSEINTEVGFEAFAQFVRVIDRMMEAYNDPHTAGDCLTCVEMLFEPDSETSGWLSFKNDGYIPADHPLTLSWAVDGLKNVTVYDEGGTEITSGSIEIGIGDIFYVAYDDAAGVITFALDDSMAYLMKGSVKGDTYRNLAYNGGNYEWGQRMLIGFAQFAKIKGTLEIGKGDCLTFKNKYGTTGLTVTKNIAGNPWEQDEAFAFTVAFDNPVTCSDTSAGPDKFVSGDGGKTWEGKLTFAKKSVTFKNIPLGTGYTITETPQLRYDCVGIDVAGGKYNTDLPAGAVSGEAASLLAIDVTFTNSHTPEGEIEIEGEKIVEGEDAPDADFEFLLVWVDKDGKEIVGPPPPPFTMPEENPITVKTEGEGSYEIKFGAITGLLPGVYYFKLVETGGSQPGWTYDGERLIAVYVDENGKATLGGIAIGSAYEEATPVGFEFDTGKSYFRTGTYESHTMRFILTDNWVGVCTDSHLGGPPMGTEYNQFEPMDHTAAALAYAMGAPDYGAKLTWTQFRQINNWSSGAGTEVNQGQLSQLLVWAYEAERKFTEYTWDLLDIDSMPDYLPALPGGSPADKAFYLKNYLLPLSSMFKNYYFHLIKSVNHMMEFYSPIEDGTAIAGLELAYDEGTKQLAFTKMGWVPIAASGTTSDIPPTYITLSWEGDTENLTVTKNGSPLPNNSAVLVTDDIRVEYTSTGTVTLTLKDGMLALMNGSIKGVELKSLTHQDILIGHAEFSCPTATLTFGGGGGSLTFTNTYEQPEGEIEIEGEKIVEGEDAPDADFEFLLVWVDKDGKEIVGPPPPLFTMPEENPITVKTEGEGSYEIKFGAITGLLPGVYYFKLVETGGSQPGWTYDGERIITVVVDEAGQAAIAGNATTSSFTPRANPGSYFLEDNTTYGVTSGNKVSSLAVSRAMFGVGPIDYPVPASFSYQADLGSEGFYYAVCGDALPKKEPDLAPSPNTRIHPFKTVASTEHTEMALMAAIATDIHGPKLSLQECKDLFGVTAIPDPYSPPTSNAELARFNTMISLAQWYRGPGHAGGYTPPTVYTDVITAMMDEYKPNGTGPVTTLSMHLAPDGTLIFGHVGYQPPKYMATLEWSDPGVTVTVNGGEENSPATVFTDDDIIVTYSGLGCPEITLKDKQNYLVNGSIKGHVMVHQDSECNKDVTSFGADIQNGLTGYAEFVNLECVLSLGGESNLTFTNTYEQPLGEIEIGGTKVVTGELAPTGETFEFRLIPWDIENNKARTDSHTFFTMPEDDTATVTTNVIGPKSNYTFTFGAVTEMQPGTYHFKVVEINGGAPGWTYDDERIITVVVDETGHAEILGGSGGVSATSGAVPVTPKQYDVAAGKRYNVVDKSNLPPPNNIYDTNTEGLVSDSDPNEKYPGMCAEFGPKLVPTPDVTIHSNRDNKESALAYALAAEALGGLNDADFERFLGLPDGYINSFASAAGANLHRVRALFMHKAIWTYELCYLYGKPVAPMTPATLANQWPAFQGYLGGDDNGLLGEIKGTGNYVPKVDSQSGLIQATNMILKMMEQYDLGETTSLHMAYTPDGPNAGELSFWHDGFVPYTWNDPGDRFYDTWLTWTGTAIVEVNDVPYTDGETGVSVREEDTITVTYSGAAPVFTLVDNGKYLAPDSIKGSILYKNNTYQRLIVGHAEFVTLECGLSIGAGGDLTFINSYEGGIPFEFKKVDRGGKEFGKGDAQFELYGLDCDQGHEVHDALVTAATQCWTLLYTEETDTNGMVSFGPLGSGDYMLVETRTKRGYQLPLGQWLVQVNGGSVTITACGDHLPPAFYEDPEGVCVLTNYPRFTLPRAGSVTLLIFTAGGAALAGTAWLLGLGRVGRRRRSHGAR